MALILCVHGIGQQLKGEEIVGNEWRAAMRDGMRLAGARSEELPSDKDVAVTFYGELFREESKKGFDAPFELVDIDEGFEADFVRAWLKTAELTSSSADVSHLDGNSKSGWQIETVQKLAVALLRYRFFAGLSERVFVGALKQVTRYFKDTNLRRAIRQRLEVQVTGDTRLIIAHSLGSVVAYEALSNIEGKATPSFITLGSPLGLPNLIFDRLEPAPVNGKATFPPNVRRWVNISDRHDIVAAVKELAPLFTGVHDLQVANEALAHDASPYLTAKLTGAAIMEALRG